MANPLAGLIAAFDAEAVRVRDRSAPQSHAAHHGCTGGLMRDCTGLKGEAMTATAQVTGIWDEPSGANTPRGWLMIDGVCVGFYLDYGPDHYRTGHVTEVGAGHYVSFCQPDRKCRDCQPGNVLAMRYPGGPRSEPGESRYTETVAQAREYVESGTVAP